MKRAALGFRMHSGWGVLVALSAEANSVEVLDRRRIVVCHTVTPGAVQPYTTQLALDREMKGAPS